MNAPRADRRQGDRRANERRNLPPPVDESLFGPSWLTSELGAGDRRDAADGARQPPDSAWVRVFRTYTAARAAIGVGLVVAQGAGSLLGTQRTEWLALVSISYAVQAITLWLLPRFGALAMAQGRQRRRQWLATIGVDLVAFTLMHLLEVGTSFNYAALLVLPVLMAGVWTSRLFALGTASAVALMLLLAAWRAALSNEAAPALMLQSGLAGLGFFAIALLAGELAGRLAREEQAARGSLELARQQAQLNRLVIEEMADGVLVMDRGLRVRAANPAARALLVDQGLGPTAPFTLQQRPAWAGLQQAVEQAMLEGDWPEAGRDVMLAFGTPGQGHTRTLRMRVRFMRSRGRTDGGEPIDNSAEPCAVLLLEDLRTLQARIRQEKLAAMGRVSAGIAHEIRNPLAAIAQANALLLEDPLPAEQRQLALMVASNVERLKRLVDEVTDLAPGTVPELRTIDASATVAEAAADWTRTAQLSGQPLGTDGRLRADLPSLPMGVIFDPDHLRRVLVNLLDNAHRHAGPQPGAIFLRLAARDDASATLSVLSDGPPIAPEVERYLFEPFFSTRSRGSGLGLYICRELCERHGASIEYRPRPAAERLRNEFVVSMRRAVLVEGSVATRLDLPDPA